MNIFGSFNSSLAQALAVHLNPVPLENGGEPRRPYERELNGIRAFDQGWGSTALGFGGIGGQAITTALTVVVIGPMGDAVVYFGGGFAYHLETYNSKFMEDYLAGVMEPVRTARYKYQR